jgi:3-hydroxyacyl-CoA dehydrogenase
VREERLRLGFEPHAAGEREIVERCLFALVNEGYRLLDEGIARSAADIDTVWIHGYGFPSAPGGPMRYAESVGPSAVLAAIRRFAERDPALWQPSRLLEARVGRGTSLLKLSDED